MPDAPVPVPPQFADPAAPGGLFDTYNAQGALGGMFAPAYIRGHTPSEQAVAAWQQDRRPGQDIIEQSRMPNLYVDPASNPTLGGGDVYGNGIKQNLTFGDPRGMVDPEALRVAAQGGKYDLEGRRNAIAARLAENARLQAPKSIMGDAGAGAATGGWGNPMSPDEYRRYIGDWSGGGYT
jgi:hypothetical protein